jgi:sugar/nucleoside kinase (ribokinase family)
MSAWRSADIAKVSEEELLFLSGYEDTAQAAQALWHDQLKLLLVTRGKKAVLISQKVSREMFQVSASILWIPPEQGTDSSRDC